MSIEDVKKHINKCTDNLQFIDYSILNIQNKSFLNFLEYPRMIMIKIESILHLESVNLVELIVNKYNDLFIRAEKLELFKDDIYVFYNISTCDFLDFSPDYLNTGLKESLFIFRNYIRIILKLLLLKEDFSYFDAKLLYFQKNKANGTINIRYLFKCKKKLTNILI